MIEMIRRSLAKRRSAYKALFAPGPAADIVLADLAKFCRAHTSAAMVSPITQQIDPLATGVAIGRQEVWLRISQHINISDSDLYRIINQDSEGEQ